MVSFTSDPIVAIATAPGRGGIGVVRVSGKDLSQFVQAFFQRDLHPRHAHYLPFKDQHGTAIDEGIALYFKAPHSYTGEDVLELQGHGGPAVLRRVLERCLEVGRDQGLRLAQAGEFTQRAFLNDRMDLAQAEAVADLIEASSTAAAKSAMASLSGAFSQQVNDLADAIIHLRMLVEATLDFPEEEIDFLEKYQAAEQLAALEAQLQTLLRHARQGQVLRDGLQVVLAGQPNVGKSSLLNALAGDDIAIVTDIAGTTRDRVTQLIHLEGVPIHIVDTAGLRDTDDTVESIGIARSWAEIEKANVILHLQDATQGYSEPDAAIVARLPAHTPRLTVYNKVDLIKPATTTTEVELASTREADSASASASLISKRVSDTALESAQASALASSNANTAHTTLYLSAKTGQGLEELRQRLLELAGWNSSLESPWLARERHLRALDAAATHLELAAAHAAQSDQVLDLFAEELRLAHEALTSITGVFTSDDLLGEIFSSFCIGK